MATAIVSLNDIMGEPGSTLQAMRHMSSTLRLVNEKLAGQAAVSDVTISAIVGMAQYAQLRNQYRQGYVHVQGLHRIVQLHGGMLPQLMMSPSHLVQKVLRYG